MKEIKRFYIMGNKLPLDDGSPVSFNDHSAIVEAKDARISELELMLQKNAVRDGNEIAELQEQVRALAAEAGRMKKAIKQVFPLGVDDENGKIGFSGIAKECYASALETAATDAALREIRAQVLDDMADDCEADRLDTYIDELRSSAARIRAGEQP